jgi:hypothetical protein
MATFRKSTPVSVAVRVLKRENGRLPTRDTSLEGQQAAPHNAEEEVLPQQAKVQEVPSGDAQSAQGPTDGNSR